MYNESINTKTSYKKWGGEIMEKEDILIKLIEEKFTA
jgi:hypothetical protein